MREPSQTAERSLDSSDGAPPSRSLPVGLALCAAAWLFGREVVTISLGSARSPFSALVGPWYRWDSINYLAIAEHGRTFYRCNGHSTLLFHASGTWCGVATWLPGYPTVASELHRLGAPLTTTLNAVSQLAWFAVLVAVWVGWARHLDLSRAVLLLGVCSVFPGAVYAYAIFPVSLALALLFGAVLALNRGHLLTMAVLLCCANFCYPSAWYATVGLVIAVGVLGLQESPRAALRRAGWGCAGLLSIPLLMLHDQIVFGHFNAFFVLEAQSTDPHLYLPGIPSSLVANLGQPGTHVLVAQAVFALLLVGAAVAVVVIGRSRSGSFDADLVLALMSLSVVVGDVISSSAGTWSRSILLALPAALVLRRLPRWALIVILVAGAVITALVSNYFFDNRLI